MRNKSSKLIMSKYLNAAVRAYRTNDYLSGAIMLRWALRYAPIAYVERIASVIATMSGDSF